MTNINQSLTTNTTAQVTSQKNRNSKKPYGLIAAISAIVALAWFFSPLDLVPDIIFGLGQLDDILVACVPVVNTCLALKQSITSARNS